MESHSIRYSDDFFRKASIYWHPAFPLLARTFENCLSATSGGLNGIRPVAETFKNDAQVFVDYVKRSQPSYHPNYGVDTLVMASISELRSHLLILEQVDHLVDEFCSNCVKNIKRNLAIENIFGRHDPFSDIDSSEDDDEWFDDVTEDHDRRAKKMKLDTDWILKYSNVIPDFMSNGKRVNFAVEGPVDLSRCFRPGDGLPKDSLVEYRTATQVFQSPKLTGNGTCTAFRSVEYVVWENESEKTEKPSIPPKPLPFRPQGLVEYQKPNEIPCSYSCYGHQEVTDNPANTVHPLRIMPIPVRDSKESELRSLQAKSSVNVFTSYASTISNPQPIISSPVRKISGNRPGSNDVPAEAKCAANIAADTPTVEYPPLNLPVPVRNNQENFEPVTNPQLLEAASTANIGTTVEYPLPIIPVTARGVKENYDPINSQGKSSTDIVNTDDSTTKHLRPIMPGSETDNKQSDVPRINPLPLGAKRKASVATNDASTITSFSDDPNSLPTRETCCIDAPKSTSSVTITFDELQSLMSASTDQNNVADLSTNSVDSAVSPVGGDKIHITKFADEASAGVLDTASTHTRLTTASPSIASTLESEQLLNCDTTDPTPIHSVICAQTFENAEKRVDVTYASHYQYETPPDDESTEVQKETGMGQTFIVDGVDFTADFAEGKAFDVKSSATEFVDTSLGDSGAESFDSDCAGLISTISSRVGVKWDDSKKNNFHRLRPFSTPLVGCPTRNNLNDTAEQEFIQDLVMPWEPQLRGERNRPSTPLYCTETARLPGRGVKFAHETSDILKSWFDDHLSFPYPSNEDVATLVSATGLSKVQVRAWFAYRRRMARKAGTISSIMEPEL